MSEHLLRSINLGYTRYDKELRIQATAPKKRGFVNEVAFELAKMDAFSPSVTLINKASETARVAIRRLNEAADTGPLTTQEAEEATVLARRIGTFCQQSGAQRVKFAPNVPGCGFVGAESADILLDTRLCEVKAGQRHFRAPDLRQVLTYAALLDQAEASTVERVILLNPRLGIYFEAGCDDICLSASGLTAHECFRRLIAFLSGDFNSL